MRKLAILATHPVQYYAPVFKLLSSLPDIQVKVFYGWGALKDKCFDPGFGQIVQWDIPLLDGYEFQFLENVASDPGPHHFGGIDCPGVTETILSWRPDVLAVYGWSYKSHLQAMRQCYGKIPIMFRGDSHLLDEKRGPRRYLRRIYLRWIYRRIDIALAVGSANREYFKAAGVPDSRIVFAPHAVDNRRFAVESGSAETDIDPQRQTVLGFVGKLEHKKAPEVLLDSLRLSGRKDLTVAFAGTGPLQKSLASASGNVCFLGFKNQSEMPQVYQQFDCLVLPSRGPNETWGLVVNEAMASGLPAIVSDAVGCGRDLVNSETGWIVKRNSVQSLADCLRHMPDRRRLKEMGIEAKKLIEKWTFEEQVKGWLEALKRVMH